MTAISASDLRDHTAEVLRRVEAGEELEILKHNHPVAMIVPVTRRHRWIPRQRLDENCCASAQTPLASRRS
jgi:prevent-host-death family protein